MPFSEFIPILFTRKQTKHKNTGSLPFFVGYENDCQQLLGVQSIKSERASLNFFLDKETKSMKMFLAQF